MPVLIKLRGAYKEAIRKNAETPFQSHSVPAEDISGYKGYMQDCPNANLSLSPVSMSRNHIDFGRVLKSDGTNADAQFVTLKNNLENDVIIKWPESNILY